MHITPYDLAQRFVGVKEIPGEMHNPKIMSMLKLDNNWPKGDEVAWCSAFVNYIAWLLRLPRSKSLLARSWLDIGKVISLESGKEIVGADIIVLSRGADIYSDDDRTAPGHVGFFAGSEGDNVFVLGGNQNDSVSIKKYDYSHVLGVRRLYGS